MSNNIKVSILVPVYNVECFIERCMVSLFEQTYDNLEYIIVNDCTKDKSISIAKEVLKRYDHRLSQVVFIDHEHNEGVGLARNTALRYATGDYVLFVDSDDYIDADLIEKLVNCQGADIIVFDYKEVTKYGIKSFPVKDYQNIRAYLQAILHRTTPVALWGKMIKTSLFRTYSVKVECGVNCSEDYMIMARIAYFAKSITICHKANYYYDTRNEKSIISSYSSSKMQDDLIAFDFIEEFYRNKGELYANFQVGLLKIYRTILLCSVTCSNKEYYNIARVRIKAMDNRYKTLLTNSDKIVLGLGLSLGSIYIKSGLWVKSALRRMKVIS